MTKSLDFENSPPDTGLEILGLQNRATRAWFATLPDGLENHIGLGRNVRAARGETKINFGVLRGELQEP